jgi:hypothetical protein
MPDRPISNPVGHVSYLEQIDRMATKLNGLSEKLNFTSTSQVEKESDQGALDTRLRTALGELETRIDDLIERTRY